MRAVLKTLRLVASVHRPRRARRSACDLARRLRPSRPACGTRRRAAASSCADVVGDVLRVLAAGRRVERVRRASVRSAASAGSALVCLALVRLNVDDVVAGGAAEHQQVEQRVGAEAVGAVHAHARAFADRVEAVDHRVRVAVLRRHDLAVDVGRDAAHLVVDGRHHRDRLPGDVDVGEVVADLEHRAAGACGSSRRRGGSCRADVVLVRDRSRGLP